MSARRAFDELLEGTLIPAFCSDPARRMNASGFVARSNTLSESDAADFLRAWQAGLPVHQGRGQYLVGAATVREQFFTSGSKGPAERSFTLWLEPIITVGAIGRLHFDHGWPIGCLSAQSADWAFDVVATLDRKRAIIAGEVKKTRKEIDDLIFYMKQYSAEPGAIDSMSGKIRNGYKKVVSLRKLRAPVLWLVGPDQYEHVFEVAYSRDGMMEFIPTLPLALAFKLDGAAPNTDV
ncbi:hypothetical protein J2X73_004613 [Novosphingobium sp. 1748]|uniref:hypothetical protein n=1 Tax=Novosphingobium sp. 1748 TaxID=2817760 RepID=UPI00286625FC|nr:hypothetical protein [Novosphingobium sp. 1748]MDR6710208.1 hypothetical protein [Novosphingobium sp. 1748]